MVVVANVVVLLHFKRHASIHFFSFIFIFFVFFFFFFIILLWSVLIINNNDTRLPISNWFQFQDNGNRHTAPTIATTITMAVAAAKAQPLSFSPTITKSMEKKSNPNRSGEIFSFINRQIRRCQRSNLKIKCAIDVSRLSRWNLEK